MGLFLKGLGDEISCNNGPNILKLFGTFEKRHTLNIIWWLLLGKIWLLFIPSSGHTDHLPETHCGIAKGLKPASMM